MKVMIIGEHPSIPSGFGQQVRLLTTELTKRGHSVVVLTHQTTVDAVKMRHGESPPHVWGLAKLELPYVDRAVHEFAPDAVICFWYLQMLYLLTNMKAAFSNCKTFFWLPWEGSSLPNGAEQIRNFLMPENVVHLSQFAKHMWQRPDGVSPVIPHCYDPVFALPRNKKSTLRKKLADKLRFDLSDDPILILNMDRNTFHKRWDLTLDFFAQFRTEAWKRLDRRALLIAHTKPSPDTVAKGRASGHELTKMVKAYGIADGTIFTGFDWLNGITSEELADLIAAVDLRISTSEGEGFGIPTIETALVGTPQLVTDHTALPELFGGFSSFLVPGSGRRWYKEAMWVTPDVNRMVQKALTIIQDGAQLECTRVHNYVKRTYSPERIGDLWEAVLTAPCPYTPPLDMRFGATGTVKYRVQCADLAAFLKLVFEDHTVFECGSANGQFLEMAMNQNLSVYGLEPNQELINRAHERTQLYTICGSYLSEWQGTNIVVVSSIFDDVTKAHGKEGLTEICERIATYGWAFLKMEPSYIFGQPTTDFKWVTDKLTAMGMHRRHDIEVMAFKNLKLANFSHQVWAQEGTRLPSKLNERI